MKSIIALAVVMSLLLSPFNSQAPEKPTKQDGIILIPIAIGAVLVGGYMIFTAACHAQGFYDVKMYYSKDCKCWKLLEEDILYLTDIPQPCFNSQPVTGQFGFYKFVTTPY